MKKLIATILVLACVLALSVGMTGCTVAQPDAPAEKIAVCFLVGNTANAQGLNLDSPLVEDTVYEAVRNEGYIGIISVDGKSEAVFSKSFKLEERFKHASKEILDMDARSNTTVVIDTMHAIVANDSEVDYYAGFELAARMLQPLEGYSSRIIVCIGTGLNSTGVLNFRNNLISADPAQIVALLDEKCAVPDFSGLDTYFQQLGDVAEPQLELSEAQRSNLEGIYQAIVEHGGGTFHCNKMIALPIDTSVAYPEVSVIDLPPEAPIVFDTSSDQAFEEPFFIPEEQISFISDTAEYLHPQEAIQALQPLADSLLEYPNVSIILAGGTAGDTSSDASQSLAESRAEAVRATLISLGVPSDRLIAIGLSPAADPWHIWNVGTGNDAAACSNRHVLIINADSELARSLLNGQNP